MLWATPLQDKVFLETTRAGVPQLGHERIQVVVTYLGALSYFSRRVSVTGVLFLVRENGDCNEAWEFGGQGGSCNNVHE